MASLNTFLKQKGYTRIRLKRIATDHYELVAKINGQEGLFILDTGASATCVDSSCVSAFLLTPKENEVKAASATETGIHTQVAFKNKIEIGAWKRERTPIILFNLSQVNIALEEYNEGPFQGIIGADLLKKAKAIIDYENNWLYMK
jgi:predicted aspartyl protease